jgi:hypothetical protein
MLSDSHLTYKHHGVSLLELNLSMRLTNTVYIAIAVITSITGLANARRFSEAFPENAEHRCVGHLHIGGSGTERNEGNRVHKGEFRVKESMSVCMKPIYEMVSKK